MGEVGSLLKETVYPSKHPDKLYHEYSMPNYDNWKTPKVVKGNSMLSNRIKIKGNVLLVNKLNVHQRRIWNVQTSFEDSVASGEFLPYISEEVNLEMLSQVLLSDSSTLDLISLSSGSSNSQKRITPEEFMKYNVMFPTDIKEQNMIAKLLNSIDKHISLHQRKLDNVKMLKKSLLQKLFPKDGEKIPELRFPGFTDAWEQRKLGEITSLITKGTTPKKQSWAGEVNFVKVENINEETNRIYPSARISLEEHQTYLKRSQLQDGDILFSIAGTLGRIGVVNSQILPANTNQAVAIVRVREGNLNYIKTVLQGNAIRDYIRQNPTVGAQPNLSLSQISEFKIGVPSLEEQVVIGDVFRHLTHFISLHQRKLDHLKELKKGLLQQMFV